MCPSTRSQAAFATTGMMVSESKRDIAISLWGVGGLQHAKAGQRLTETTFITGTRVVLRNSSKENASTTVSMKWPQQKLWRNNRTYLKSILNHFASWSSANRRTDATCGPIYGQGKWAMNHASGRHHQLPLHQFPLHFHHHHLHGLRSNKNSSIRCRGRLRRELGRGRGHPRGHRCHLSCCRIRRCLLLAYWRECSLSPQALSC